MDSTYKIVTKIRCTICNIEQCITTELTAPREDVAIDWANAHVEQGEVFAEFEKKHSIHRSIDKYKTTGAL